MKTCSECGEEKDESEFYKNKSAKNGLRNQCKTCKKAKRKVYYETNKDWINQQKKEKRKQNPEKEAEHKKKYYQENREYLLEKQKRYRERNPEKEKEWRENNREYINSCRRERQKNDPDFRLKRQMRVVLWRTLNLAKISKNSSTFDILGYSYEDLVKKIEFQFTSDMSWDKVGPEIHIDHKIPMSHFIKKGETRPHIINALSNLQPMWGPENLKKSDKLVYKSV